MVSGSPADELPWDRPKPHPDDGDLFTMSEDSGTSDSTEVLTIGEETFPVVAREPLDEKCLASPAHQLYQVEIEDGRKFEVCDECHSAKLTEPAPESPWRAIGQGHDGEDESLELGAIVGWFVEHEDGRRESAESEADARGKAGRYNRNGGPPA